MLRKGDDNMPVITVEGPKVNKETKAEIAREVTSVVSKAYNMPKESIIVSIKENDLDNVSQGGVLISDKIANKNNK